MSKRPPAPGLDFQVRRTKPVQPSKLGVFSMCPLRYVFETEGTGSGRIPPGVLALRGNIAHHVIKTFARHPSPSTQELRQAFHGAATQAVAAQEADPLIRFAFQQSGLSALFSAEQVASACQFIRKVLARRPEATTATFGQAAVLAKRVRPSMFGAERKLSSHALDMEGWADLLYKDSEGTVHVVDFKTGNVLEGDGQPKLGYLLQVAAYGVLVKEMLGLDEIALELVGAASGWTGTLHGELETMARGAVSTLRARLPKQQPLQASSLAAPGASCQSCASRPSCPAYMQSLEGGSEEHGFLSPFDVAGKVTNSVAADGYTRLRVLTPRGKYISLGGIPSALYPRLKSGIDILGFSLGSYDVLSRAAFPANFYVFRPDNPKASAFSSLLRTVCSRDQHTFGRS